jgi:hypothetical protein
MPNRTFNGTCLVETQTITPAKILRPSSPWLKPRLIKLRKKLPDYENPRAIATRA